MAHRTGDPTDKLASAHADLVAAVESLPLIFAAVALITRRPGRP